MTKSIVDNKKSKSTAKRGRGRPPTTGIGTLVGVRFHDDDLTDIDAWRAKEGDEPGRPEAIRRLTRRGLGKKFSALVMFGGTIGLAVCAFAQTPTAQPADRFVFTDEQPIGCRKAQDRLRLGQLAAQGDEAAYKAFMGRAILADQCRFFKTGGRVVLEERSSTLAKIRAVGEPDSYWVGYYEIGVSR